MSALARDGSGNTFWRERKKLMKEPVKENLTVKDENGKRQIEPSKIMETMATYYENLYRIKPVRWHEAHQDVQQDLPLFQINLDYEDEWYNIPPTEQQITDIIERKKNGKATTNIKKRNVKTSKSRIHKSYHPSYQPYLGNGTNTQYVEPRIHNQFMERER